VSVSFAPLPHEYPFRFADRTIEKTGPVSGRVRAAVSMNARSVEGGRLSPLVLAELIAQSALLLEGGDRDLGRTGFLAGLSSLEVLRVPEAGDLLTVDITLAARLGPAVRFDGVITDDAGRRVASGGITVRSGTPA
jgi:hypothetical protein